VADAGEQTGDSARAVIALRRLTELDPASAASYWLRIGSLEMKQFHVHKADDALRRSLEIDPASSRAWRLRAQLTAILGRAGELTACLIQLIRHNSFTLDDLVVLAGYDPYIADPARLGATQRATSDATLLLLAQAREEFNADRRADAEKLLIKLVSMQPSNWEAQGLLGEQYAAQQGQKFMKWHAALPPGADDQPRIWLARGLFLRGRNEPHQASRCFWETVVREPELLIATEQLGQTLLACGELELGRQFLHRAKRMQQIVNFALQMDERQNWNRATALIDDLSAIGRIWEAWAWSILQVEALPRDERAVSRCRSLERRLSRDLPRTDPDTLPGREFEWPQWGPPRWSELTFDPVRAEFDSSSSRIGFVDEGQKVGLDFEYISGLSSEDRGHFIYETTGGGAAALDFDGDGWVDLYFAQGGAWPVAVATAPRDALFRNQQGSRFEDVTNSSRIVETGYSQGVAAGDYDNDGFPDLYVANIGCNRLFRNNGDGTFADVTESANLRDEAWTSSCAMADLNGDGLPDLFDVNYVQGKEIFTTLCHNQRNEPLVCRPTVFEPALDRVALNRGNGTFATLQEEVGLNLPEGRGLGLIIADFNDDRQLDVFVANDQGANHLLINLQSSPEGPLMFREEAHLLGVAVDRVGVSKAGMGIAAGDVNRDGRLDLFVTTFANENKLLYLSQPDGSYVDCAQASGLRESTFPFLGFGTQFLDADLDGLLDLVILNGHIDEFPNQGQSYRMRPQFFRGLPAGRFGELKANQTGPFFDEERLGRSLSMLDWNRDGLVDFVATYLDGPVALVTNTTRGAGNSLRLKLVGTVSSRDAIGTCVRVTPRQGDAELRSFLVGGDGYESSCERLIQVGVSASEHVDRLEIDWPSGMISVFHDVPCQMTWLAIEGAVQLQSLLRPPP
jgi:tetratricopeptide (TPR) repeat protein